MNLVRPDLPGGAEELPVTETQDQPPTGSRALAMVKLARPKHWIKNLIVLFPVVFAMKMSDPAAWRCALIAAAGFCLVSSAIYVLNDIHDRRKDRQHPKKRLRPLASGLLPVSWALVQAAACLAGGIALGACVNVLVAGILAAYVVLQAAYTYVLKRKMLVDVMCIAMGFVMRAVAGAVAIGAEVSPWLVVCTFTICLFMGFCKRRNEVATLGDNVHAEKHRATLGGYSPELLTHLITLSAGMAIISYLLYATHPDTVARIHTTYLIYTVPIVIYAIARFAMFAMIGRYSDPTDLITRDWPFQVAAAAWMAVTVVILLWGEEIQHWAQRVGSTP